MKILKNSPTILLIVFVLSLFSCGSAKLTTVIEKGKIDDNTTITLVERNITLKPDEFFSLSQLGLQASQNILPNTDYLDYYIKKSSRKYPMYNITLQKPGYKTYYGKIAFFNAPKKSSEAVTRYYQLNIPKSYFDKSTGGRVACLYEYSKVGSGTSTGSKIARGVIGVATVGVGLIGSGGGSKTGNPTWIIWMSDTPL